MDFQIEEHFADKGVSIVGYFHANERFDDQELGGLAKNVGDHIYRYLPQAAVLLVLTVSDFVYYLLKFSAFLFREMWSLILCFVCVCLQLDNKKLAALSKTRDRSPVVQVGILVYFLY